MRGGIEALLARTPCTAVQRGMLAAGRPRLSTAVLLNLVDNAVKYNEPEGAVTLALVNEREQAVITVGNTGRGIAPAERGRVFERFFRGEEARRTRAEGRGLGLAIARWIVTAHGGTIDVSSEPGGLTVATVKLPAVSRGSAPSVTCAEAGGSASGVVEVIS